MEPSCIGRASVRRRMGLHQGCPALHGFSAWQHGLIPVGGWLVTCMGGLSMQLKIGALHRDENNAII